MLASLAGRIYGRAPQQNAFPLDSTAGMASLKDIYALIESAAKGELPYKEFDRRLGFAFYELPVDVMRSEPATFASLVVERMEFVREERAEDEREMFESPQDFLAWLRAGWRAEEARNDPPHRRAV